MKNLIPRLISDKNNLQFIIVYIFFICWSQKSSLTSIVNQPWMEYREEVWLKFVFFSLGVPFRAICDWSGIPGWVINLHHYCSPDWLVRWQNCKWKRHACGMWFNLFSPSYLSTPNFSLQNTYQIRHLVMKKWELIKESKLLKIKSKILSNLFNKKYGLNLGDFNNTTGTEWVKW